MTGLDVLFPDKSTGDAHIAKYLTGIEELKGSTVTPQTKYVLSNPGDAPGFWDSLFYYAAKPEEWVTKGIGNLLSSDPKYDFGRGRPGDQVGFTDLFGDAFEGSFNTRLPILSAVLGISAAIVNPLDPLNKLKILGLTEKGIASEKIAAIMEHRPHLIKEVAGKSVIDTSKVDQALLKAQQAAKTSKEAAKASKPTITLLERSKKEFETLNGFLEAAQKDGMKIEDIKLAPTRFEQIQKGQRRLIGLSSPMNLDQLSMFGAGKGAFDHASNSLLTYGTSSRGLRQSIPAINDVEAAFVRMVTPLGKLGQYLLDKGAEAIHASLGYNFVGARFRPLVRKIDTIINSVDLEIEDKLDRIKGIYMDLQKQGVTSDQIHDLNQTIMDFYDKRETQMSVGDRALLRQVVQEIPRTSVDGKNVIRKSAEDIAMDVNPNTGEHYIADTSMTREEVGQVVESLKGSTAGQNHVVSRVGRYSAIKTGSHIVLDHADTADLATIKKLRGVIGATAYEETANGLLVGKRLPGYKDILDPIMPGDTGPGTGVIFDAVHADNLEVLAAQLASKKLSLGNLSAKDFLISDTGQIQLINPDVVMPAKSVKDASILSKNSINNFVARYQVGHSLDRVSILDSVKSVNRVSMRAKDYIRTRRMWATDLAKTSNGELAALSAHSLMREANNTLLHQAIIEDRIGPSLANELGDNPEIAQQLFEIANGVTDKREAIRKALAEGGQIPIEPVEIAVDELGNIQITKGRNDLLAAMLEGIDTVPVRVNPITTEWIDSAQPFTTTFTKLDAVFFDNVKTLAYSGLSPEQGAFVSHNYKLLENGKFRALTSTVERQPNNLPIARGTSLKDYVSTLFSYGTGNKANERLAAIHLKALDNVNDLILAESIIDSQNLIDLTERIEKLTGVKISIPTRVKEPHAMETLHTRASQYREVMASRGVFTERMLDEGMQIHYNKGSLIRYKDGTMEVFDMRKDADLEGIARAVINDVVNESNLMPFQKIRLVGKDTDVTKTIGEMVGSNHPNLKNSLQYKKDLRVPKDEVARLEKMGIHIDPKEGKLDLTDGRPLKYQKDLSEKQGKPVYTREHHAFYFSDTGRLFVDTRQDKAYNAVNVLHDIFGEGRIPRGEVGFVTDQEIIIQYPAVDVGQLNRKTLAELRARIQRVSKALGDAGYSENLRVRVVTPIDEFVWKNMYNKETTLKDILGSKSGNARKGWLKLPEEFDNYVVETHPDSPLVYRLRQTSETFKHGEEFEKVASKFANEVDELRRKELEEGIPTMFRSFYIPRVTTPDAQKALDLIKEDTFIRLRENKRIVQIMQGFMKERSLSDLTIPEINEFVTRLRKAKMINDTQDVSSILHEIALKASEKDAPAFVWMADLMNKAGVDIKAGWFYSDPLLALSRRTVEGGEALRKRRIVDELAKSNAVLAVTPAELQDLRDIRANKNSVLVAFDKIDLERKIQQKSLDEAIASGKVSAEDIAKQQKKVDDLTKKLNAKHIELDDYNKRIAGLKNNPMAFEVRLDTPTIYIESSEARKLISSKHLELEDIATSLDNGLVAVPASKVIEKLGDEAKIYLFPDEIMGVVERYFGSSKSTRGRGREVIKIIDKVTNLWRSWTLFPIPSYHVRNFISNAFLLFLGDLANIDSLRQSGNILNFARLKAGNKMSIEEVLTGMKNSKLVNSFGEEVTAYDIWSQAVKEGVFSGGQHYNEFHYAAQGKSALNDFEATLHKMGFLPSSDMVGSILSDNALLRFGKKSGQTLENWFRMGAFIESWKRSGDFTKAGLDVKKLFYDFRDLSMFERNVLRRAMPFYTWSRFNVPRMIETMFTKPIAHYRISEFFNQYQRQVIGGPLDEKDLPEFLRKNSGIAVINNDDGTYMMRVLDTLVPAYEAYELFNNNPFEEVGSRALQLMTPLLKIPIEQLMNQSMFTGEKIEEVPGQPAKGWTFSSLGMSRRMSMSGPLGVLNVLLNESLVKGAARPIDALASLLDGLGDPRTTPQARPAWWAGVLDLALGRAYRYDPEKTRALQYRDWVNTQRKYQNLYKYSLEHGDDASGKFFLNELNKLRLTVPPGVNK